MVLSNQKKIRGTKYSLAAEMDYDSGELRIILFFDNREEKSIEVKKIENTETRLRTLLSQFPFLDVYAIIQDEVSFLEAQFGKFVREKDLRAKAVQPDIQPQIDMKILSDLLDRIGGLESLLKTTVERMNGLESYIATMSYAPSNQSESDVEKIKNDHEEPAVSMKEALASLVSTEPVDSSPSPLEAFIEEEDKPKSALVESIRKKKLSINYADELNEQGKTKEYVETLRDILQEDTRNIEALKRLGNIYFIRREFEAALKVFKKAYEFSSDNYEVILGVAKCYHFTRRSQLALEYLNEANEIEKDSEDILKLYSLVYEALGHVEKSDSYLEKLSNLSDAENNIEMIESSSNDNLSSEEISAEDLLAIEDVFADDEKLKVAQEAEEQFIEVYERIINMGHANYKLGKYREALEMYKRAATLKPTVIKAWHNVGIVAERLGDKLLALDAYDRAKKISSKKGDSDSSEKYKRWIDALQYTD